MMKTIRFLSIAALAFVGAITIGCSSDDDNNTQPPQPETPRVVTLTTTISLDKGANTRALTEDGVKTFAKNDQIAVVYTNTSNQRVKAVSNALADGDITNNGKEARITVKLTEPVEGSVDYIYPAAMTKDDGTINYSALCMQDGTLPTLASNLDCAWGTGNMTLSGSQFALPANVELKNQLTICEFTIKNSVGTEITSSITRLTVSDGINTYTVSRSATAGPIYVAMQPVSSGKTISFVANDATNSYCKSVTNKTLAANNMYPINVTMDQGDQGHTVNLSGLLGEYVAQNGDMLTGELGGNHKISIAAGATVTFKDMDINYGKELSGSFAGITCLGNATIIVSGTDYVKGFSTGYPGIYVPSNSTLTITGAGTLYALGHEYGAGIGSGKSDINGVKDCGNIVIQGGTIWGTGGGSAAGIGSGAGTNGVPSSCGNITIKSSVTHVYATAGTGAEAIGKGQVSTCGTVTIEGNNKVN